MKHLVIFVILYFFQTSLLFAQQYRSLDSTDPISFKGDQIEYQEKTIALGERCFFVDGNLSAEEAAKHPFVFNSFQEAATQLVAGTEKEPMQLYIAPYVYWIDNPDDTEVRKGKNGREPFGMIIECPYLQLIGLNKNPANVVLAANRGQTQGAVGNFTMFDFWGDGLLVKDLTMGNYCNVDLDFPLKPQLSREKRMSAITQAHVAYCHGDKAVAENVRFISRLNMNPLNGAKRILFNNCYMECTDDALTGTGVYLNCTLEFYAPRPFWRSDMGGAVFLNCDFNIRHNGDKQYFCKAVGPLSIIDCRYHSEKPIYAGWTATPTNWLRCYQYNVTLNSKPYTIGADKPQNTICLDSQEGLSAYRIIHNEKLIYNTYNLLRGDDDWDPLDIKQIIETASEEQQKDYSNIPTCLAIEPLVVTIQTGNEPIKLRATTKKHGNYTMTNKLVKWRIQNGCETDVKLSTTEGYECVVAATNHDDQTKQLTVIAYTDDGLECAAELTVIPNYINAPTFAKLPSLSIDKGLATLHYELNLEGRSDESLVTWYRCTNAKGEEAIPVYVSRFNTPQLTYPLHKEDIGYYLKAVVEPKHLRCEAGKAIQIVSSKPIHRKQINQSNILETNFLNFSTLNQPKIIPGFWTIDGYKPIDTEEYDWQIYPEKEYWYYGEGINGAIGTGLLQQQRGARLLYTPINDTYQDMSITLQVDPCKTAGQGFGSATGQYLDLYIKFDTQTLTGYGLRVTRTTKYSNAVDFLLMEYKDGVATPISKPVSAICYRTNCTISLKTIGNKLIAHVETATPLLPPKDTNLKTEVDLEADIQSNTFGGTGIQHTGSWGENATMLHRLKVEW